MSVLNLCLTFSQYVSVKLSADMKAGSFKKDTKVMFALPVDTA